MDQASSTDDSGITLRIKFKSETVDQFIARYGPDVSPGGIFIRTRDPLGVGTNLRFELSLSDGQALLVGQGTVVWVREADQSRAGVVPGMGVRFDKLTAHSQTVLGTILAGKARRDRGEPAPSREIVPQPTAAAVVSPTPAAAPERPRAPSVVFPPAARPAPVSEAPAATSDPWQPDKTEIAAYPPSFALDSPRTSEELSLSGAEPVDEVPRKKEMPPPDSGPPSRRPTPALGNERLPAAPRPTPLGMAHRDPPREARANAPSAPVAPLNGPRPSGPISPLGPPSPLGARPSASFPTLRSEERAQGDAQGREMSSATMNLPPAGRARALAIIGLFAAAAAVGGFLLVKNYFVRRAPTPAVAAVEKSSPAGEPSPSPPAFPVTAAPTAAPGSAPVVTPPAGSDKTAATTDKPTTDKPTTPPRAAEAVAPAAAQAPPPSSAASPPSAVPADAPAATAKAVPVRTKVSRPRRAVAPRPAAGEGTPPAADLAAADAPADDQPAAPVEDIYWLKVTSTPRGAEVLIDGQLEGRTPFQRRIFDTTRPYALTVRKQGFDPHEQLLSTSDDWVKKGNVRTLTVNAKLPKAKAGSQPPVNEPEAEKASDTASPAGSNLPPIEPPPPPATP